MDRFSCPLCIVKKACDILVKTYTWVKRLNFVGGQNGKNDRKLQSINL